MKDLLILVSLAPMILMFAAGLRAAAHRGGLADYTPGIQAAAWMAVAASVFAALIIWCRGPMTTDVPLPLHASFPLYLDALTALMLVLVSFLGAMVVRYSVRCMIGHDRQYCFHQRLCMTIASVMGLLICGNLLWFTLAWMATSLCLHQLLTFNAERTGAILAARKKFIVSRLGDLCLIGSMVTCRQIFHSWNFATIFRQAHLMASSGHCLGEIALLDTFLVLAACLKSAQFPFHSWLPDTMETPTPVSALMHAGIINAGGFLIIRLSALLILCPKAMAVLALIGAVTAIFGSTVMMAQTSIKRSLAFSTVGQMGFMMLECGLGAFGLAVLHLAAHALYKAHAFLSSGSRITRGPARIGSTSDSPAGVGILTHVALISSLSAVVSAGIFYRMGFSMTYLPLLVIVIMALSTLLSLIAYRSKYFIVPMIGLLLVLLLSAVYAALDLGMNAMLASTLPPQTFNVMTAIPELPILLVLMFVAAGLTQIQLWKSPQTDRIRAIYVHTANGFYIGYLANQMVCMFWPLPRPARRAEAPATLLEESLDVTG